MVKSLGGGDGIDSPAYQLVPSPLQASTLWISEGPLRLLRGGEAQTLRPLVLILKVLVALVTNWWALQDYCLLRLNNGQCGEQCI